MKEANIFQIVVTGFFIALFVGGLIAFSLFKSKGSIVDNLGVVRIWGTLDMGAMTLVIKEIENLLPENYVGQITYKELDPETVNDDLVEAIAAEEGPDLFLLRHDNLFRNLNKLFFIPEESFSKRIYLDSYIEGAEVFMDGNGIYALPLVVDPMIMYWNRDILTRGGISEVPKYWDEFFILSPKLTKRDSNANILQATVPFGEYRNVTNAKEILSSLILQADNPIIIRNHVGALSVVLNDSLNTKEKLSSAVSALRFYTEFSNPIKAVYSWNRALSSSKQLFISGELAFYFGFASELPELRKLNPNLNFDVAVLPQIRDDKTPTTFGYITGVALLKSSPNISGSFRVAKLLSSDTIFQKINETTGLPPPSRKLLSNTPSDAIQPIFYSSSLITKAWIEPGSEKVDIIFRDMIESISSGRLSIASAVAEANAEIRILISPKK